MNEAIFFLHILAISAIIFSLKRLGAAALTCFCVLQSLFANLFVLKQIMLFGFVVTCSDAFSVGAILTLNILQEEHGIEASRRAILISFLSLAVFALMSWFHLLYIPTETDNMHAAYRMILDVAPRLVIASIVTSLVSQGLDSQLFGFLQKKSSLSFSNRCALAMLASQAVDTLLFTFLGLYGLVDHPWDVFFVSYFVKIVASLILLLLSSHVFSVRSSSSV